MVTFIRNRAFGTTWTPEIISDYRDEIIYAIKAYDFLIDCNCMVSATEFADIIEGYSVHPRSQVCAALLRSLDCQQAIEQARRYEDTNGMVPSVFRATALDGTEHVGFNYQPTGTQVGHRFHYDHGCGTTKNTDAQVIWMKSCV